MGQQDDRETGSQDGNQRPGDHAGAALRTRRLSALPAGNEEETDKADEEGKGDGEGEIHGAADRVGVATAVTPCSVFSHK